MTVEQRLIKVIESLEKIAEAQATTNPAVAINALATAHMVIITLADEADAEELDSPTKEVAADVVATSATHTEKPVEKLVEPKKPTKDDIGAAVRAAVATHGAEKVKKFIIDTFGVERASTAPEDKWSEVITKLKGIK